MQDLVDEVTDMVNAEEVSLSSREASSLSMNPIANDGKDGPSGFEMNKGGFKFSINRTKKMFRYIYDMSDRISLKNASTGCARSVDSTCTMSSKASCCSTKSAHTADRSDSVSLKNASTGCAGSVDTARAMSSKASGHSNKPVLMNDHQDTKSYYSTGDSSTSFVMNHKATDMVRSEESNRSTRGSSNISPVACDNKHTYHLSKIIPKSGSRHTFPPKMIGRKSSSLSIDEHHRVSKSSESTSTSRKNDEKSREFTDITLKGSCASTLTAVSSPSDSVTVATSESMGREAKVTVENCYDLGPLTSWLRSYNRDEEADFVAGIEREIPGATSDAALAFSQICNAFSVEGDVIDDMALDINAVTSDLEQEAFNGSNLFQMLVGWLRTYNRGEEADLVTGIEKEIPGATSETALAFSQIWNAFAVEGDAIDGMASDINVVTSSLGQGGFNGSNLFQTLVGWLRSFNRDEGADSFVPGVERKIPGATSSDNTGAIDFSQILDASVEGDVNDNMASDINTVTSGLGQGFPLLRSSFVRM